MTELKKQLLTQLSIIAPHVEEMSALLYLVQNSTLSDEVLQMIEQIISNAHKLAQFEDNQESLEQSIFLIRKIREQELRDSEQVDLLDL